MCKETVSSGQGGPAGPPPERCAVPPHHRSARNAGGTEPGVRLDADRGGGRFAEAPPRGGKLHALLPGGRQCSHGFCQSAGHPTRPHDPSAGACRRCSVRRQRGGAVPPEGAALPHFRRHHRPAALRRGPADHDAGHQQRSLRRAGRGPRGRQAGLSVPGRCRGLPSGSAVRRAHPAKVQRQRDDVQSLRSGKSVQCAAASRKKPGVRLQILPALRGRYRRPDDEGGAEGIPRPAGGLRRRRYEQRHHPRVGAAAPAAGVFRAGPVFQRQRHRCVHPCRTGGRIMAEVISVSALNQYVKTLLDANDLLFDLALRGEIANFVQNARSSHCYFSLRDETSSVKAVMFRSDARRLGFRPEEGMKVIVRCRATLYERDGAFQVYVNDMFPDGIGSAQLAFEQLKAKLDREGLFAAERKKPLPRFPKCIGLVTSKTGAALQDIRNVIGRRWPAVRLLLCPVNVQGFEAADVIAAAIDRLDKSGQVDEIIVARGGGSREDLWVFNAERIARAASRCKTPLISAIGHEIDFTILDFVADQRAPTPSAAAELAVPDRAEFSRKLCNLEENIHISIQNRLSLCYNRLDETVQPLSRQNMQAQLAGRQQQVEAVSGQLQTAAREKQQDAGLRLRHAAALAATLNPYGVLARGYALVQDEKGRICAPDALREGQKMTLCGAVNRIHCTVDAVEGPNESTQEL